MIRSMDDGDVVFAGATVPVPTVAEMNADIARQRAELDALVLAREDRLAKLRSAYDLELGGLNQKYAKLGFDPREPQKNPGMQAQWMRDREARAGAFGPYIAEQDKFILQAAPSGSRLSREGLAVQDAKVQGWVQHHTVTLNPEAKWPFPV